MASLMKSCGSRSRDLTEEEVEVWDLVRPSRGSLARLKRLSLRNRAWFAVLDWKQRGLMDVVIKTVDRIRSLLLLRVLAPLVRRLLTAIGGYIRNRALALMDMTAYETMKTFAQKTVQTAQKWGNKSALKWLNEGFIKYLLVMNLPQNRNSIIATP